MQGSRSGPLPFMKMDHNDDEDEASAIFPPPLIHGGDGGAQEGVSSMLTDFRGKLKEQKASAWLVRCGILVGPLIVRRYTWMTSRAFMHTFPAFIILLYLCAGSRSCTSVRDVRSQCSPSDRRWDHYRRSRVDTPR